MTRPQITLRRLRPDDANATLPWIEDEEFCRANEWPLGLGEQAHLDHWHRCIASPPAGLLRLAVEHQGRLIGYVDLVGSGSVRELGYAIGDSKSWGQGLGTASALAMVNHGFTDLNLERITAEAHAANARSVAVLKNLGFHITNLGDPVEYRGTMTHTEWWELTRDEWARLPTT